MSVINDNLTHIPRILLKLTFMFDSRNQTITINVTVCIENNVIEINADKNKNRCKRFLLALFHSIVMATILVKVQVDAAFSGGYKPISLIWLTFALHLTLRSGLLCNRQISILWIA